jgi:hypothetical protein
MMPNEAANNDKTALEKSKSMIRKAMGVLREIAEDPVQRANYERRLEVMRRGQLIESDPPANQSEDSANRQAEVFVRQIQFYQWLLDQPRLPIEELGNLPLDELRRLADELRQRVSTPS